MNHTDIPFKDRLDPNNGEHRPWFGYYPPGVDPIMTAPEEKCIPEMVTKLAARHGDKPAFTNFGVSLSFAETDALVSDFAAFLHHDLGLKPGDRIAIQLPNVLQYPVAMFGALRAGLIVVNTNPLYKATEMLEVFSDSEPKAIVVLANFADKLDKVISETTIKHIIITEVADLMPQPKRSVMNLAAKYLKKMVPKHSLPNPIPMRQALARGRKHEAVDIDIKTDDIAFLQYTGGTTGGAKAAMLTHGNLLANQAQFISEMRAYLTEGSGNVIAALPLYHVFSLTVNCMGFYGFGGENVLITNPRDIKGFIKTLDKTNPETMIIVSTLGAALLDHPDFKKLQLTNLKLVVAGGMALRTSVAERWLEQTGQPILEGYGLTEASPVVTVNPPFLDPRKGTIGIPLPSTDVQIRTEDGGIAATGEPGELAVRGPQIMAGYWRRPEETARVIDEDGWLLTGDVAKIDKDGYLSIVDRKKEIIIVSGFNVYPGEVEDVAMSHPKVVDRGRTNRIPTGQASRL